MTTQTHEVQTFRRPASRVVVDLVGPLVGAVAFLGVAVILVVGLIDVDPLPRIVGVVGFGIFGVALASGVPQGIRRGLNRTVLEVGPDGLWTPELGRLAWPAIADVHIESVSGFAGGDHDTSGGSVTIGDLTFGTDDVRRPEIPTARYTRIGIVPADPAISDRARSGIGWRVGRWMSGVSRSVNPRTEAPDFDKLAPFGVYAYEIDGPLGAAVDAIRHYRPVA